MYLNYTVKKRYTDNRIIDTATLDLHNYVSIN